MSGPQSFYLQTDDDVFESTPATSSPWDATLQHGGPPSALLARAVERCSPRPDMIVAKITVDFLGALPQGRLTTTASVIRPGKRIELVEGSLSADDRPVATARAWRIRTSSSPTNLTDAHLPLPLPPPQPQRYLTGSTPSGATDARSNGDLSTEASSVRGPQRCGHARSCRWCSARSPPDFNGPCSSRTPSTG